MGKEWERTSDQTKYLHDQFDAYHEARQNDSVDAFRIQLYRGWEKFWPEQEIVFPSWKEGDPPLTKDQLAIVHKAIHKRTKQLYDYVRWHSSAKPIRTKNPRSLLSRYVSKASSKGRKKSTRRRMVLEVYSDLYYDSKLRNLVKEELEQDPKYISLPQSERSGYQMAVYHKIRAKAWATESDEVKAEVQQIYDQKRQVTVDSPNEEEGEEKNDDDADEKSLWQRQQDCINIIGDVITAFLQDASEATGWAFIVLGGGMDKQGEIKVATSSVGKTVSGSAFHIANKNWQEGVVKPWYEFLHLRHSIEERHRRAMAWVEDSNVQASANAFLEGTTTVGPSNTAIVNPAVISPLPSLQESVSNPMMESLPPPHAVAPIANPIVPSLPLHTVAPQQVPVVNSSLPLHAVAPLHTPIVNPIVPSSPLHDVAPPQAHIVNPIVPNSLLHAVAPLQTVTPQQAAFSNLAINSLSHTRSSSIGSTVSAPLQTALGASPSLNATNPVDPNSYTHSLDNSTHVSASLPNHFFDPTVSAPLQTALGASPSLNATNPVDLNSYAHSLGNSTHVSASLPNHFFNPTLTLPHTPQAQVAPLITEHNLELSPMSKFMVATGQSLYQWEQDDDVDNTRPFLPLPNMYDSQPAAHWTAPATSGFTSTVFRNMQDINPAIALGHSQVPVPNISDHITGATTTHPPCTSNIPSTIPGTSPVFMTVGVANSKAVQSAPASPLTNLVLSTATNGVPAETEGGHVEDTSTSRPKKRKSNEEDSAQFILPDGSHRRHKPRHIDENFVPSTTVGWKGKGGKKAKSK